MTYEDALEILKAKLAAGDGDLLLITSEEDPFGAELPITDPHHYVLHEITSIEVRPDELVEASTAESDWILGGPDAVLKRLTEHQNCCQLSLTT